MAKWFELGVCSMRSCDVMVTGLGGILVPPNQHRKCFHTSIEFLCCGKAKGKP